MVFVILRQKNIKTALLNEDFLSEPYGKLFILHPGNHAARSMMEETEWQNVQNVELTSRSRRNLGRWLEDPTSKANACN